MNLHRRLLLLLVVALMVAVTAVATAGPTFGKPGQDSESSVTTGELAALWWEWALSKPLAESPLIGGDPNYSEEQCDGQPVTDTADNYWFLAGTFDGSKVKRTCTIPADTTLFFPAVNFAYINDPKLPEDTEEYAREQANAFIDSVVNDPEFSISVTVDGEEINSDQIVRADSPLFTATVPKKGLLKKAGSYSGVSDGLWVTLSPLSEGEHEIEVEVSSSTFSQDNTYIITVE
jgi:hypothetical protein